MANNERRLLDKGLATIRANTVVKGCPAADVRDFQAARGIVLPESYVAYLKVAGKDPGSFMVGSDLAFDQLDRLQKGLRLLLEDGGGPPLPTDAFAFIGHQDYQFLFFRLGSAPEPAVESYLDEDNDFSTVFPSFAHWLAKAASDEFR